MIAARWFDGRSSRARPAQVALAPGPRGPVLRIEGDGGETLAFQPGQVGWPEPWSADRAQPVVVVDLRARGSLEIDDARAWREALAAAGGRPSLAQRMQTRLPVFVAVVAVAAAALWAFYRWGTPWAATQISRQVPLSWETSLAERGLRDLDASYLKPSQLPSARQAQLREQFDALVRNSDPRSAPYPGYAPQLTLRFRSGLGANAFALPGGTIVLTDGLVEVAAGTGLPDEALAGVLAHEIGHVVHRHTTRMLVEQGVLNVGLGLALGDVSTLLSMGSSLLTGLAYRRGHEAQADCYAVRLLVRARLPTAPMADLMLALEEDRNGAKPTDARESDAVASLLSSHPAAASRARMLRQGTLQGCPAA